MAKFNYTNYEQATRLIKLGLPIKSADVAFNQKTMEITVLPIKANLEVNLDATPFLKPIWSVFRLMEVYERCVDMQRAHDEFNILEEWHTIESIESDKNCDYSYIEYIIKSFEFALKNNMINFDLWKGE